MDGRDQIHPHDEYDATNLTINNPQLKPLTAGLPHSEPPTGAGFAATPWVSRRTPACRSRWPPSSPAGPTTVARRRTPGTARPTARCRPPAASWPGPRRGTPSPPLAAPRRRSSAASSPGRTAYPAPTRSPARSPNSTRRLVGRLRPVAVRRLAGGEGRPADPGGVRAGVRRRPARHVPPVGGRARAGGGTVGDGDRRPGRAAVRVGGAAAVSANRERVAGGVRTRTTHDDPSRVAGSARKLGAAVPGHWGSRTGGSGCGTWCSGRTTVGSERVAPGRTWPPSGGWRCPCRGAPPARGPRPSDSAPAGTTSACFNSSEESPQLKCGRPSWR